MKTTLIKLRWWLAACTLLSPVLGDPPATLLGSRIAAIASDPVVLAANDPAAPDVLNEAAEIARLERLPSVAIPIQDETLAGAITTIASASGMNFIAPPPDEFPERITLTTKVSPWRLLHRLGDRYRFTMAYRDGIWEFNREAVGSLVAKVYFLKHTNLDVFKTSQNSFSAVGAVSSLGNGSSSAPDGGSVFSAQTQKMIEDIRELIGLPSTRIVGESDRPDLPEKRGVEGKAGGPPDPAKAGAKVIYIPDVNALYVACTRSQHDLVAGYIHLIDQPPRQIHIEARFFETTWDPKAVLGLNPQNLQPNLTLSKTEGAIDLARRPSAGERVLLSMDALNVQVNALQTDSRSRLVQNPSVVTANNREVYFSVGDEEPFVSSNNIYPGVPNGGFGATTASVAIRRIGTSVNVVPTIFEGEAGGSRRIRLVVRIEVGALKGFRQVNSINIPVVSSQKYEYTTYVGDNQALAFGGLAGIGETEGVTKVPVAGDVPIVGYLFKSKSREVHQRNLVAYVIARVVDAGDRTALPAVPLRDVEREARSAAVFPR